MSNSYLQVSDIGEKKLIERIIEKSKNFNSYSNFNSYNEQDNGNKANDLNCSICSNDNTFFPFYIGDDAALINFNNNKSRDNGNNEDSYLVATSDLLLEKSHFPKQMSYFQMGWKSIVVNVSDLGAMGANPKGILISLAVPPGLKLSYFDEIIDGILKACYEYNIPLVGGDTNQADQIIISGTALGKVEKRKAMKKSGFKKGDLIAITGELGLAALGFEILKEENNKKIEDEIKNHRISQKIVDLAIEKALKPRAKLEEGIAMNQFASSATDITDGLASELYELYNADKIANKDSNLGLRIYEDKIVNEPLFKAIANVSKILNKNPLDFIFHVGEDFELLFTFNKDMINYNNVNNNNIDYNNVNNNINSSKNYNININNVNNDIDDIIITNNNISKNIDFSIDFIVIGEINNSNKVEIEYSDGKIEELSSRGYEHLSKDCQEK